ncbi:hypothetical protein [Bacillus niameyensis]|uniref:hypothetical protein n=1 Tax=Bacillus niameyensis TaxID=1522308 RepID=UPI0007829753|nr:hypothetical protein [Bacillus niameyensis]
MSICVEIKRILSYGKLAGRNYNLVCQGNWVRNQLLKVTPVVYIQNASNHQTHSKSPNFCLPLTVYTEIEIIAKRGEVIWKTTILIDLKNWHFTFRKNEGEMPDEIKVLILSSFGVQQGENILCLHALASRRPFFESQMKGRSEEN